MKSRKRVTKPYAETMADILTKAGGSRVMWGDAGFLDECFYSRNPHLKRRDSTPPIPLDRWRAVLAGLARRPDLFKAYLVPSHTSRGSRGSRVCGLRCFELRRV